MSSHGPASGRSGALLSRLLWPSAMLFAATLWIVFSTILWTSDSVNEIAAERQKAQLSAAVEQHLGNLGSRLLEFARVPNILESRSRFGVAAALRSFDSLLLITPDWTSLAGTFERGPATDATMPRLRRLVNSVVARSVPHGRDGASNKERAPSLRDSIVAELLFDGLEPYAALAMPVDLPISAVHPSGLRAVLVAIQYLDPSALGKIATLHDVHQFRVSREQPVDAKASLPVRDNRGDIAAYLTWAPNRPGDLMRERLVPLTLAGFCLALVLFGLLAGYLHWLARDLATTEARSRDLLGRDPLSGLANRLLFSERLDAELDRLSRAKGGGLAVLFLDLDRFKDVNDTYGHQAGDDLIQLVAQRLTGLVRTSDTIARFGGDEFAIIQTGIQSPDDAGALSRRILDALTQPFALAHNQVIIGASIGIALALRDADNRENLMRLADTALYHAKSEGRNRYSFFQSRMDDTIRMRKVVEEDLRNAIAEDQLVLHYQPVFSSDGATVVAVEALVRWPHPTQGLILPGEFIPIAEERGLVIPLGEWVMRRACEDGKRWPGIRVAVNVSAIQFRHRDFVAKVVTLLEETGFDPSRLELELTEGVVVEDADAAENAMMELRALGVHLALDDFGTGYSSLIYLRRFAFDTIKIDRSFLESMEATGESAILVHSMVHLGRALGLTVTAEGVETVEQHRFLQALGCHQLQGYLFSRPVPAEEIDARLGIVHVARPEAA